MTVSVKPGRTPMAQDAVIASIRDRIAHGLLRPGDQVRQQPLADELGVSVVPVREALNALQAEGLLVYQPHRGYFVAQFDLDDLEEAYTIRGLLEDEAVARGVPELRADDLAELEESLATMRRIDERAPLDVAAFTAANRSFQFVIFDAAGMPRLLNLIRVLWDTTAAYRALLIADETQRGLLLAESALALAAAKAGDTDGVIGHLATQRATAVAHFGATFERTAGARDRRHAPAPERLGASPIDLGLAMLGGASAGARDGRPSPVLSPMADAFVRRGALPPDDPREGEPIRILLDDGSTLVLEPHEETLRWEMRPLVGERRRGRTGFAAARPRPEVLLLDFHDPETPLVFTVAVNESRRAAVVVFSQPGSAAPRSVLRQVLRTGELIDADGSVDPIEETRDLVGARLVHDVAGGGLVEHGYLNSQVVLWQRLGEASPDPERGQGQENVAAWSLDERLYLLTSVGRHGSDLVEVIDLDREESIGRVRAEAEAGTIHVRFGARLVELGRTIYPPGYEPA